ncbi:unnamed protein product, partial [Amoebophrya sp. A25]
CRTTSSTLSSERREQRKQALTKAADCFVRLGSFERAGECKWAAGDYTGTLHLFRSHGLFEKALEFGGNEFLSTRERILNAKLIAKRVKIDNSVPSTGPTVHLVSSSSASAVSGTGRAANNTSSGTSGFTGSSNKKQNTIYSSPASATAVVTAP